MYEGRNAQLFHPLTAVITWMSDPAQPSFVWQIYHYDLEPNSSLFGVKAAGEMVHIQFNESNGELQVINNLPEALNKAVAHVTVYDLDGSVAYQHETPVTAAPATAANLGPVQFPTTLSSVHFLKLDLHDAQGKLLSTNFYWRALPEHPDDLTDMNKLPTVTLEAKGEQKDADGKRIVTITLHNPTAHLAVMAHLQLRKKTSGERVLPVYYSDNYVSLVPDESRTISIEAALDAFNGEDALVVLDGWNVTVPPGSASGVAIAPNLDAQPDKWPVTGLPFQTVGLR
jgi:hypothetical protein